ncbi:hypothetical protein [Kitasatospora sp. NPDC093102]|uniref:hypothetical protein n=1 Tax=Kitasatospora sp. NPDC093102 TaxID=3155069 RepID=UPI00343655A0
MDNTSGVGVIDKAALVLGVAVGSTLPMKAGSATPGRLHAQAVVEAANRLTEALRRT